METIMLPELILLAAFAVMLAGLVATAIWIAREAK